MELLQIDSNVQERLDSYLLHCYPWLSMGLLCKFLRENRVKVNKKKQPLSYRLQQGDVIQLYFPQEPAAPKQHSLDIIYEDDAILVTNKPAGLPVDADDVSVDTLLRQVIAYLQAQSGEDTTVTALLCHRLDTGTSGLVLLAKSEAAREEVMQLIAAHRIEKTYLCVTFGHPQPAKGVLRGFLKKDAQHGFVTISEQKRPDAKPIETQYATECTCGPLALLQIRLITGRTHQIRAHMANIGCPVLGDSKYGNNSANRAYRAKYQTLCAYSLRFPTDLTGVCASLAGQTLHAPVPWYAQQMRDGTLKPAAPMQRNREKRPGARPASTPRTERTGGNCSKSRRR